MMKKSVICLALLLLLTGCSQAGTPAPAKLLPAEIENIMDDDVAIDGPDERAFDAAAYDGRMFMGTWILQEVSGDMPVIEVPAPAGSAQETLKVEAFPAQMIFQDAVRGEQEAFRIAFDDYYYLQAVFNPDASGEEAAVSEPAEFRMLFDVYGGTLAMGFTGEVADELYYNEDVDHVSIQEEDYGFEWTGYALTLKYGGASASYYPSTYEGDMQAACEGFSGSNGQTLMPGWQFSPLYMNGDGTGTVGTRYGTDVNMTYAFGQDGSFSIATENGEEYTYDTYWYSDSCLTLPAGDMKLMYQHDLLSLYTDDPYRRQMISADLWSNELTLSGKELVSPLGESVSDLLSAGYKTDVDAESSMMPSGCVSPAFDLTFRTSHLTVQAVNPTDIELPLSACIVWHYTFDQDDGRIIRWMNTFFDSIPVTCGETTLEDLGRFSNLYPVDDSHLTVQTTCYIHLYDSDFADYSARLLDTVEEMNASKILRLEMEGDILHSVDCCIPELAGLNPDADDEIKSRIAENIRNNFLSMPELVCDAKGAVLSEWSDLFLYGTAELSESGQDMLDEIIGQYTAIVKKYDQIEGLEIGAYARIDLMDEGQSFTVPRAEAVSDYVRNAFEKSSLSCPVYAAGYGESEYLLTDEAGGMSGNLVAFRVLTKSDQDAAANEPEIELVYKAPEDEAGYAYMKPDEALVGKRRAAFAEKYSGSYSGGQYTNEAIGMAWTLPEGWHFYNDAELGAYNGAPAENLLLKNLPIYIFAAVDEDYDAMIDVRLYPCDTKAYEGAGEAYADSLMRSYESVCRADYQDVSVVSEDAETGRGNVRKGTFSFSADEQTFIRKQYYVVCDDAVAVISLTGTEEGGVPDDPGL